MRVRACRLADHNGSISYKELDRLLRDSVRRTPKLNELPMHSLKSDASAAKGAAHAGQSKSPTKGKSSPSSPPKAKPSSPARAASPGKKR